jgi:hypothetical protein
MIRGIAIAMFFLVVGLVAGTKAAEAFPVPGPTQSLVKLERNFTIHFKNTPKDIDKNGLKLECEIKK